LHVLVSDVIDGFLRDIQQDCFSERPVFCSHTFIDLCYYPLARWYQVVLTNQRAMQQGSCANKDQLIGRSSPSNKIDFHAKDVIPQ
jgi:hypothetical protein